MADSKINGLTALTDAQVDDSTRELPLAAAISGIAGSATIGQIKKVASTQPINYTATGSEGTVLTIAALAGRAILAIFKEGTYLYPVVSAPDSVSYIWDNTNITFGLSLQAGERYGILWKNI